MGSDCVSESEPRVVVREAEQSFVLPFPTEVHVDQLPAVIVETATETATEVPVEPVLLPVIEDTTVPPDVEQRLIYRWLYAGPWWAGQMVAQAPPAETRMVVPLFRPDLPHGPRRRHDAGDGTARVMLLRE